MAAHNPALTQLLAALNAAPHAGMGNDFFAHVGSSLALARSVPSQIAQIRNISTFLTQARGNRSQISHFSFCTCGVRTTRLCTSYTRCTARLCKPAQTDFEA